MNWSMQWDDDSQWDDNPNNWRRRRVIFPRSVKNQLFTAQRGKCSYCGHTHRMRYLEIDHKYPFSRGGGDEIDNLQLLCISCNMRKGIQSDEEFRYRYQRLLPADGSIPHPPIPQDYFSDETQRTRRPKRYVAFTTRASPLTARANVAVAVCSRPLWCCSS